MSLTIMLKAVRLVPVYTDQLTANVAPIADQIDLLCNGEATTLAVVLWHPDRLGIHTAGQVVDLLTTALVELQTRRDELDAMRKENGTRADLEAFVRGYLKAARCDRDAEVHTF